MPPYKRFSRGASAPALLITLLAPLLFGVAPPERTAADEARLDLVRTYAERVLDKGRDRHSGKETPLLVDGVNVETGEAAEWLFEEQRFVISNLASQQNLFRTLDLLTELTGEPQFREAAEAATRYHFENLLSECGLLRWGGHQIIDLATLEAVGHFDANCHELKNSFPYYQLMWRVDPDATRRYLRAFWNAHIFDWGTLDMNRHGSYGREMGALWDHDFDAPEPFFEGRGLTFINCGTDLIYAGGMLYLLGGETGALEWAERLAHQYVRARHPKTGLGVYQYSKPIRREDPPSPMTEQRHTWSTYGDRAENQFGEEFGEVALEGYALWGGKGNSIYGRNALIQLHLAEQLGEKGKNLLQWTVDGMKAYVEHAYKPEQNEFVPMWADGTDLTGYEFKQFGYFGSAGTTIGPVNAGLSFLVSYARAHRLTQDPELWEMVRHLARGNGLGDLGGAPASDPAPDMENTVADPDAVFAILEIHQGAPHPAYLELARRLADNLVAQRYHHGYFVPSAEHVHANFNTEEPLAILAVEAALRGEFEKVPPHLASRGYIHGRFDGHGRTTDHGAIWNVRR